MVLMCFVPSVANASPYEVWGCADAEGRPIAVDGWTPEGTVALSGTSNECAAGKGLFAGISSAADLPANQSTLSWHFRAPADTRIASFRIWRWAYAGPNSQGDPMYVLFRGRIQFDGVHIADICSNYEPCTTRGDTAAPLGDANLVTSSGLADVRDLWMNAGCGGGGTCLKNPGQGPWSAAHRMYRSAIVLQDDTDPLFTAPPSGSLLGPGPLSGTHGVSFSATDTGSGVQQAIVEVDGRVAVRQELGCAPPYTAVVPCKLSAGGTVTLDTASLPDGQHSIRLLLTDATQSNTAAYGPLKVTTANTPAACAPAGAPEVVTRFDRRSGTIAYGGRLNVRGTLAGAGAGAVVRVISQVKGASAARLVSAPLTTDAAGRFAYRVPAGPSRTLRFAYRRASEATFRCSKPLRVNVRARVTLSASPRTVSSGSRVRFSGRLGGGHVPRNGKVVELQAFERGRWRTFRTVRSSSKGVFGYRYRFSFRASGTTFPVRARVRSDASYPWALGTSASVRVRVR